MEMSIFGERTIQNKDSNRQTGSTIKNGRRYCQGELIAGGNAFVMRSPHDREVVKKIRRVQLKH